MTSNDQQFIDFKKDNLAFMSQIWNENLHAS